MAMNSVFRKSVLFLISLLAFSSAEAKLFRNAYVQFELPTQWNCNLEGTEWVCSSQNRIDSKESIIILTAKEVGPQDSFAAYERYLKTPKQLQSLKNRPVMSQVKSVRQRRINDHQWIDALHLGSEIPGYYTRYLATIKDKLAILVTLSAHQKYYTKYSNDFFKAVESLRVVASKDLFAPRVLAPVRPGSEGLGGGVNAPLPPNVDMAPPPEAESSGTQQPLMVGLGLLILIIAGYLFLKKK